MSLTSLCPTCDILVQSLLIPFGFKRIFLFVWDDLSLDWSHGFVRTMASFESEGHS